jgi:Raf kinase inhibitor-like YbhB/YbcL family protein
MNRGALSFILVPLLLCSCNQTVQRLVTNRCDVPATISITSPAFGNGQPIPQKYGTSLDISPPLNWSNLPPGTKSLVLLAEDPDVPPPEPFVHWVVYNIPPELSGFPESMGPERKPKAFPGLAQGHNSRHKIGYAHPAPYDNRVHHYHFEIYALDDTLDA